jgi:hypothetical protein
MEEIFSYVSKSQSAEMVNIDGSIDLFYRYKMPQLTIEVIGQGKMVKTFLTNIDSLAEKL